MFSDWLTPLKSANRTPGPMFAVADISEVLATISLIRNA
jgi:hypothetical protein